MLAAIILFCLLSGLCALVALAWIDFKTGFIPNELTLVFFVSGLLLHVGSGFYYSSAADIALGGLIGFGFLYLIRALSNFWYKKDSLGLGDVKLMAAAGIWLGPFDILTAFIIGAIAGMLQGLLLALLEARRTKTWPQMSELSLPAGPGFAMGIVFAAILKYKTLPLMIGL